MNFSVFLENSVTQEEGEPEISQVNLLLIIEEEAKMSWVVLPTHSVDQAPKALDLNIFPAGWEMPFLKKKNIH